MPAKSLSWLLAMMIAMPMVNLLIGLMKTSAIAAAIGAPELLYQAQQVNSLTYRPMEVYTTIAAMYFLLLFTTSMLARVAERRLAQVG